MRWVLGVSIVFSGLIAGASVHAATVSTNFNPVLQVDNSSSTTDVAVTAGDFAGLISDFNITLDFTKCGTSITDAGACSGPGLSFNGEIVFRVTSPGGTTVNLVDALTYSGQNPGDRVQVTFDDEAASAVGGPLLTSGIFRGIGLLSAFDGESAIGDWTIFFQDTVRLDPLSLNGITLEFNGTASVVPLPAALPLFASGLVALGIMGGRRKRQAVVNS